jgi:hypothetical protein
VTAAVVVGDGSPSVSDCPGLGCGAVVGAAAARAFGARDGEAVGASLATAVAARSAVGRGDGVRLRVGVAAAGAGVSAAFVTVPLRVKF